MDVRRQVCGEGMLIKRGFPIQIREMAFRLVSFVLQLAPLFTRYLELESDHVLQLAGVQPAVVNLGLSALPKRGKI